MIKKLDKKNTKEILSLHKKANYKLWKKIKKEYNTKEIEEYVLDTLKRGEIFGYFNDGELIACSGIVMDNGKIGEIRLVLVEPEFQGKGIGKKMIKEVEDCAKKNNINKFRLNVFVKNKAAEFYEKLGYEKYIYVMTKKK